jgi:hypothetical protein
MTLQVRLLAALSKRERLHPHHPEYESEKSTWKHDVWGAVLLLDLNEVLDLDTLAMQRYIRRLKMLACFAPEVAMVLEAALEHEWDAFARGYADWYAVQTDYLEEERRESEEAGEPVHYDPGIEDPVYLAWVPFVVLQDRFPDDAAERIVQAIEWLVDNLAANRGRLSTWTHADSNATTYRASITN